VSESPETTPHPLAGYSRERQIGWDEAMATVRAARATVPAGPEPWHPVPSCACGCWDNFNEAARPVPAAEPDPMIAEQWAVPAADDRERTYNDAIHAEAARPVLAGPRCGNCPHDPDAHSPVNAEACAVAGCPCPGLLTVDARATVPAGPEHALHFDPDCEECAYLARPTRETLGSPPTGRCFAPSPLESPETTRRLRAVSAERYWLNEQGWLTPHPEGQWVHVKDVGIDDEWLLDAARATVPAGPEHALHFDPDCEECAYLARPTRETLGSPPTGDASLREAAQRVSDKASVIARGGASPRWVVDDATFSALRAALSTGDADRLHEAIRAVYYEDKHPDLSGGLTTDPADARLAAAILRRLG
jgi:hypothetical protein